MAHNAPQLVPLVDGTLHLPVLYAHNQLLRTYGRRELVRTLAPVHRIVCVSGFLADETASLLPPTLRDRVVVVHNGVDAESGQAERAPRGDVLHVVFVGRMIPDKGRTSSWTPSALSPGRTCGSPWSAPRVRRRGP
ncbi:glycosyltransferase [Oerskovia sp. M15]